MKKINFYPIKGGTGEKDQAKRKIWQLLGLATPIKPATEFMPDWWKNLPKFHKLPNYENPFPTAKRCPSIFDSMQAGYIMPMWSDLILRWDGDPDHGFDYVLSEAMSDVSETAIETHHPGQITDAPFIEDGCKFMIKLNSPWFVDVPKGISLFYTSPFYHINNDFTVIPGILDADIDMLSNKEIKVFLKLNNPGVVKINRGDPLLQIIPFKRENYEFDNGLPTDQKLLEFDIMDIQRRSIIPDNPNVEEHVLRNKTSKNMKPLMENRVPKKYA